jgi:hypothetical protein
MFTFHTPIPVHWTLHMFRHSFVAFFLPFHCLFFVYTLIHDLMFMWFFFSENNHGLMLWYNVLLLYVKIFLKIYQDKCLKLYLGRKILWLICWQNSYDQTSCLACQQNTHFLEEQSTSGWSPDRKLADFHHLIK